MKKIYKHLIIIFCYILISMALLNAVHPVTYELAAGDTCPFDVFASRSVVDKFTTEKQKNEAVAAVEPQYEFDNEITQSCQSKLASLFNDISKQRNAPDEAGHIISNYCISLSEEDFKAFRSAVSEVQQDVLTKGVLNIDESVVFAHELFAERLYGENAQNAAAELIKGTLEINKTYSEDRTNAEKLRVREATPDVTYKPNQIVVRRGEIITEAQFSVMSDLGLIRGSIGMKFVQSLGIVLIVLMCFIVVFIYMKHNGSDSKFSVDTGVMISILCALTVQLLYLNNYERIEIYMVPVAVASVLTAVLTNVKFSLLINILMSIICGIALAGNAYYIATIFFSGCVGAFLFAKSNMRKNLAISSLVFCGVNALLYFISGLAESIALKDAFSRGVFGIACGFVTSIVVIGTLPLWETIFDIVTPYRLTELSNSNQPLMKKLIVEAPGTYHHSLMVGNLAEAACEAVGGDYLLARVGAYYHDIGKLSNPEMYAENQYVENHHDNLSPETSAEIILSHVKKGLQLAEQYKLPKSIKQIIASHHGTTKVVYFYYRAKEENADVDERLFTYKGPKPQSREEAIVMLADSVEAAVRSLDEKNETAISDKINKIIKDKLSDGQLVLSPLTFAEIDSIKNAFIKVFGGYFHSRIKYPEKKDTE